MTLKNLERLEKHFEEKGMTKELAEVRLKIEFKKKLIPQNNSKQKK